MYVDSPLAIEATNVFNKNVKGCFDEDAMALVNQGINPLLFQGLKTTITSDESRQINFDTKPKVAAGMYHLFCWISGSGNAWKKADRRCTECEIIW